MFVFPCLTRAVVSAAKAPSMLRTFTFVALRRPTVLPNTLSANATPMVAIKTTIEEATETLMPRISESPVLRTLQVRCGPRENFGSITHITRKRRHGFLSRVRTRKGRNILKRRKLKGRRNLSH